ncbi:hypothetical protein G6011_00064 [Alternaria panax]|uniref:SWIM-type domain-containing protein n=1 Tax=Alternaria panax TaxID=48097 RepID=A0AAD4IIH8_9PLEO|nr:hypothetical protein G6011_00064 [Alternaria panax]
MATTPSLLPTSRTFITKLLDSLSSLPIDQSTAAAVGGNDNANANANTYANTNPLTNLPDATKKQLLSLQVLFPSEFVPALDLLDRRLVTRFRICDEEELAALKTVEEQRQRQRQRQGRDVQMQEDTEPTVSIPPETTQQSEDTHTHPTPNNANNSIDSESTPQNDAITPTTTPTKDTKDTVYYVHSAQHRPSRFSTSYDTLTTYQVRLRSWNCSCPAFAFSAFPPPSTLSTHSHPSPSHSPPPIPQYNPTTQQEDEEEGGGRDRDRDGDNDNDDAVWFGGTTLSPSTTPPVCKHLLACILVSKLHNLFGGFLVERSVTVEEAAGWAAGWGD